MKKDLLISRIKQAWVILILFGLILPSLTTAVTIHNPVKWHTFAHLIRGFINFLWWIALALFPLMIVVAGFYFVTSAGNPAQIEKAKGIALYSIIGLLLIILASALVTFIERFLL